MVKQNKIRQYIQSRERGEERRVERHQPTTKGTTRCQQTIEAMATWQHID